jgi:cbb3-type cytochrome oxidase maturation protein
MSTTQLAVILFLVIAVFVVLFIWFFAWAVKSGQFRDIEGIKYRMLEESDEESPEYPDSAASGEGENEDEQAG